MPFGRITLVVSWHIANVISSLSVDMAMMTILFDTLRKLLRVYYKCAKALGVSDMGRNDIRLSANYNLG